MFTDSIRKTEPTIIDDSYEVIATVGHGRNSIVYKASPLSSAPANRRVKLPEAIALKVLVGNARHPEQTLDRLRREALAMLASKHRHVIRLIDYVARPEADLCYLVMEYAGRGDLKQLLEQQRLAFTPDLVFRLMLQILTGLQMIHRAGIIHRDIKPENLLLTDDYTIKLADFSIAYLPIAGASDEASRRGVGTFDYLAPECLEEGISNEATDVYSTAVTCYQLLTGKLPFDGTTITEQIQNKINDRMLPLSESLEELPPYLEEFMAQALTSRTERRYQTAADFREAIDQFLRSSWRPAPAVSGGAVSPAEEAAESGYRERPKRPTARLSSYALPAEAAAPEEPEAEEETETFDDEPGSTEQSGSYPAMQDLDSYPVHAEPDDDAELDEHAERKPDAKRDEDWESYDDLEPAEDFEPGKDKGKDIGKDTGEDSADDAFSRRDSRDEYRLDLDRPASPRHAPDASSKQEAPERPLGEEEDIFSLGDWDQEEEEQESPGFSLSEDAQEVRPEAAELPKRSFGFNRPSAPQRTGGFGHDLGGLSGFPGDGEEGGRHPIMKFVGVISGTVAVAFVLVWGAFWFIRDGRALEAGRSIKHTLTSMVPGGGADRNAAEQNSGEDIQRGRLMREQESQAIASPFGVLARKDTTGVLRGFLADRDISLATLVSQDGAQPVFVVLGIPGWKPVILDRESLKQEQTLTVSGAGLLLQLTLSSGEDENVLSGTYRELSSNREGTWRLE